MHQGMPEIIEAVISHRDSHHGSVIGHPETNAVYVSALEGFNDYDAHPGLCQQSWDVTDLLWTWHEVTQSINNLFIPVSRIARCGDKPGELTHSEQP